MNPGQVSVIIPTYNRPIYLRQAVESVLCQTYPSVEILVIDDGSADGGEATREALKPYLPQLTYLYQENGGIGAAVNRGIALAQGEYIQRLDDDDRLLPEKVARSVEALNANPNAGLAATGYHVIDTRERRIDTRKPRSCPNPARLLNALMGLIAIPSAVMVPASVHQKIGGYRTDLLGEDYEMWIRIAKAYAVETIDEPLVEYRKHSGNITRNQAKLERDILHFIREYVQTIPLEELIPNLQSKPHAYALRAVVYLLKDGEFARTTALAREELKAALQLSPGDPLLSLWKGVLAVHGDDSLRPLPWEDALPAAYQPRAEELGRFACERKQFSAREVDPWASELIAFRQQFSMLRSGLIAETFRRATGEVEEGKP